ncbi:flavin-containing monooxygenase [Hymenobacter latericus]|uniref:flavin-containing monooxygenase n=1 Tax=Hymenobacter sp. YIM 151858-1 TaxID=2987688 RepID=UPI0022276F87|nr:NAD(P)/FAD-dependent oxidoreductase [Hymenobacter sp. YIM 151858-1]UYZ57946.1 NAD(P)/FAD-dependent oxidoreductase [Hymenobacter sp. YIM 151858-1]
MPSVVAAAGEYRTDTLIIGAGQAGLAAAYYLQQAGVPCLLLEQAAEVGRVWASRYASLRLFSPAWASALPGLKWPGPGLRYPTKDEAAQYLRLYANYFNFEVHLGQRVVRVSLADGGGFGALTEAGAHYLARRVIVCTGGFGAPHVPAWASALGAGVQQLHSSQYQAPEQLLGSGAVAVVGSGNSALQIAADVAATGRPVYAAFDPGTPAMPNNTLMWVLLKTFGILGLSRHGLLGRWLHRRAEPVVAGDLRRLRRFANVHWIGRARQAESAALLADAGRTPPLQAVVWATGFRPDYRWLELPVLDSQGFPLHHRGISTVPGLAFLGLPWLDSRGSALMGGVGADAQRVVKALLASQKVVRQKKGTPA